MNSGCTDSPTYTGSVHKIALTDKVKNFPEIPKWVGMVGMVWIVGMLEMVGMVGMLWIVGVVWI